MSVRGVSSCPLCFASLPGFRLALAASLFSSLPCFAVLGFKKWRQEWRRCCFLCRDSLHYCSVVLLICTATKHPITAKRALKFTYLWNVLSYFDAFCTSTTILTLAISTKFYKFLHLNLTNTNPYNYNLIYIPLKFLKLSNFTEFITNVSPLLSRSQHFLTGVHCFLDFPYWPILFSTLSRIRLMMLGFAAHVCIA